MPRVLSEQEITLFRKKLCAVAARQFSEKGYEKVSMRSLADALDVSRMTPYRYFKDKAEILAAVRASGFRQLTDSTEAALANAQDPIARLESLASVYFQFAVEHEDIYRLMFDMSQQDEAEHPELAEQLDRLQHLLIRAATAGVDAGIVQQDATLATQLFWAGMHGVVTLHLSKKLKLGWSFKELSTEMVETLYRGMISHER